MKTPALHLQDKTRNVRGDLYPTLCGVYVIRTRLHKVAGSESCVDCANALEAKAHEA